MKGFIAVAIDGRYHGERTAKGPGAAEYVEAILRAYRTGNDHPFLYDTVWDAMRLIDYLETREDIDSRRIGMIGFSKGGIEAYFTAAVDPRVAVAIPCIGVQNFRWGLENDRLAVSRGDLPGSFEWRRSGCGNHEYQPKLCP